MIEERTPEMASLERRVEMTVACRDCDDLPKVPDAGTVQALPDGTKVQIMHNGLRVVAGGYYGAWMQEVIARARGHHEPQEERLFHEILRYLPPDATMIELGGYWLYYSLWFLKDAPGRRALAVEPEPENIAIGRANARLNGREVEIVHAFVGAEAGDALPFRTEKSGLLSLPCVTVPQLLREQGIDRLTLLHCDAQGAEVAVLKSCSELLMTGRIEWLCISTHAHQISGDPLTHQRCIAMLHEAGATILAEHDVHESYSGDGLIVARVGGAPPDWPQVHFSRNRYSEGLFRNPLFDLALAQEEVRRAMARAEASEAGRCAAEQSVAELKGEMMSAMARVGDTQSELERLRAENAAMRRSTSWRLTAPLRALGGSMKSRGSS